MSQNFFTYHLRKNQIVAVCSAVSGVTDDLLQISRFIQKGNKTDAQKLVEKIINKHKQLAKDSISNNQKIEKSF